LAVCKIWEIPKTDFYRGRRSLATRLPIATVSHK
jgi:hypothetical protein